MSFSHKIAKLLRCSVDLVTSPMESLIRLSGLTEQRRGIRLTEGWRNASAASWRGAASGPLPAELENPLRVYFDSIKEGPGVWKWLHYFEIYHRHLQKFIGKKPTVVEIGVFSGGSMPMWHHYFGEGCQVHGIDIQEECRAYEGPGTTIHIGDQADRSFWKKFREKVPSVDIVIDDGGHEVEQQMVTMEEMLPHLQPGGVFICEDAHGIGIPFHRFVHNMADQLNAFDRALDKELICNPTPFQSAVHSVHLYPYVVAVEMRDSLMTTLHAPKHGTQWQPFLS